MTFTISWGLVDLFGSFVTFTISWGLVDLFGSFMTFTISWGLVDPLDLLALLDRLESFRSFLIV